MQNFSITRSSENIHRYAASSALLARNHRSRIETQVSNILGDEEPGIVLITTGSDGRDENKIFESDRSNIELLMVGESMDTIGHMTELLESLKQKISTRIDFCEVFSRDSRVVSYADGDPALVFPSRMWDSKLMWGNVSPYHPLRTQVSEEILKIPKMTTHFKPRLDYHRRALRHGSSRFKGVDIPLYDLQKGILSYGKNFGPDGVTE